MDPVLGPLVLWHQLKATCRPCRRTGQWGRPPARIRSPRVRRRSCGRACGEGVSVMSTHATLYGVQILRPIDSDGAGVWQRAPNGPSGTSCIDATNSPGLPGSWSPSSRYRTAPLRATVLPRRGEGGICMPRSDAGATVGSSRCAGNGSFLELTVAGSSPVWPTALAVAQWVEHQSVSRRRL